MDLSSSSIKHLSDVKVLFDLLMYHNISLIFHRYSLTFQWRSSSTCIFFKTYADLFVRDFFEQVKDCHTRRVFEHNRHGPLLSLHLLPVVG